MRGSPMGVEDRQLDIWVDHGIISSDQANKIREFENTQISHSSLAIEILGYVGATLIMAAGATVLSESWPDFEWSLRLSILLVGAGLLTWVGTVAVSDRGDPLRRLGQTALMLTVPTVGLAASIATDNITPEISILVGFLVATSVAIGFYLRGRSYPQHIALFVAIVGSAVNLILRLSDSAESLFVSLVLIVVGVAWVVASTFGPLKERTLGEVLGCGAAIVGSVILVTTLDNPAPVAIAGFIGASVGVIWFGLSRDRTVVLVTGMIGIVLYVPWLITETLGNTVGAPIALFAAGALLIGSAIFLLQKPTRD